MSLKRNIAANYASQLYVAGIGIAILPLYIRHMGAEAYGLIGFFTMMQSWFGLLDLGLTPTIARETARYHGGTMPSLTYRQLFRALSLIFLVVALVGGGSIWLLSEAIAARWLKFDALSTRDVAEAVEIMGISVALRWMGGLHRGVVSGAEHLVWLSGFNALIATLRFVAVFASMAAFGFTPRVFFLHQLAVAALETAGLLVKCHRLLPERSKLPGTLGWSFAPVRPLLKFSLTIAFTSGVWIAITQADRLILSGILNLAEYGYFSLAVLVAGGITLITSPISGAIMPRMARLHVEGKGKEFIDVYRSATRLVVAIAVTVAITLVVCAEAVLFAWTGDAELARHASPIMQLYAIGNGILAVGAFPFYMQYAKGNLFYHFVGNAIIAVLLLPAVAYAARMLGGVGAGYAWVIVNTLYFLVWVAYVHAKLEPGLHWKWMREDVAHTAVPLALLGALTASMRLHFDSRIESLAYCLVFCSFLGFTSMLIFRRQKARLGIQVGHAA